MADLRQQRDGRRKVLILQEQLKHYRKPLFEKLHAQLADDGIDLTVAYGLPTADEQSKNDTVMLHAQLGKLVTTRHLAGGRLVLQQAFADMRASDLTIVEQAARHLISYAALINSRIGRAKFAYWGHGRNASDTRNVVAESVKRVLLNQSDWWFAYAGSTVDYLVSNGVDRAKITDVQNSIDVNEFRSQLEAVNDNDITQLRNELGLAPNARVALFCGSLYANKQLPFLIAAARQVAEVDKDFALVVVGDGPDRNLVAQSADKYSWLHYMGARLGGERAIYFRLADVLLCPAALGLAILDAFAAGLPVLITDVPGHGPEASYLEAGKNGLICGHSVSEYADMCAALLKNDLEINSLSSGALASSQLYSIENMVSRFRSGIMRCLEIAT